MNRQSDKKLLRELQRKTFNYFTEYYNENNGLVADKSLRGAPASITAVGLGLTACPVAVEQGYLSRDEAVERVRKTLRFFSESRQGPGEEATGYQGFYYHFINMEDGRRYQQSELSTGDTAFLIAGMLAAANYFDGPSEAETEIRALADRLYRRVNWRWALNGERRVAMAWKPETGFLKPRWEGYSEALLLYVLGLASPSYPLPAESYQAWTKTYRWVKFYDYEYLYAGPLFIHQLSHIWLDLRGIQDAYMRDRGTDYVANSRAATYAQQAYARKNPRGFKDYGEFVWGITASDGPGEETHDVDGQERRFYAYLARGIPHGPDDGTISPWAVVTSLPFTPEIVIPTIRHIDEAYPEISSELGFKCSFNPTYPQGENGWISDGYYGLDQGPIVLMIENYFSGLIWRLMRRCPPIGLGLRRAGFSGGWLEKGEV